MAKRNKTILTAVIIGMIVAFCLAAPIASIYWFNANPSLSELQEATVDKMTLSEAESNRLSQQLVVGAVIDFAVNFILLCMPFSRCRCDARVSRWNSLV